MPTTVHHVEALPEGLATTEAVNLKVPLIESPAPVSEETKKLEQDATPAVTQMATDEPKIELFETSKHVIPCSSKFPLSMEVNIVKDRDLTSTQRCYIMSVHNYGFDNSQFDEFINCPHMGAIRSRTVWLNVNLPGQEVEAADLTITKYPSIEELSDELISVLDYFKLAQVVLLGEGVGATICTRLAMRHPDRCYGLICIEPTVSAASYMETLKSKMSKISFKRQESVEKKKDPTELAEPLASSENESFHLQPTDNTTHEKFKHRNAKNLALLNEAILERVSLVDEIPKLQCDVLVATNKNASGYSEAKKLYRGINEANRANFRTLVNTPFIELEEGGGRVLENASLELVLGVQYFLQGIGLLSAMPLRMSFSRQGSVTGQKQKEDQASNAAVVEITSETPCVE